MVTEAKERLDYIIKIARVHLYKPIHIAEVLYRSRIVGDFDITDLNSFRNPSLKWRNVVTQRLLDQIPTSSARYQHDIWNDTAMPLNFLSDLDRENKNTKGAVEAYIYNKFAERQGMVIQIIDLVENDVLENFQLRDLLKLFAEHSEIRKSIDKTYEIVVYSLLETIIRAIDAKVRVSVEKRKTPILTEFSDLTKILLGVDENTLSREQNAHIYRAGVTNAADKGLDMWANFGVAVQVKHLTINEKQANSIVDEVETDRIVIVCCEAEKNVIEIILKQISWGKRVCGIITESDLVDWYEKCLRGRFSEELAFPLMERLAMSFDAEFPYLKTLNDFINERGYTDLEIPDLWNLE